MRSLSLIIACITPLVCVSQSADECSLYLAETVDSNGALTMGIFSAVARPAGSPVGYPDIVLPLVDIPIHNSPTHEDDPDFWWVWNDLLWGAADAGGISEGVDVKSASLGLGSLTRGNPQRSNVFLMQSQIDNSGLHRSKDPGAGAISHYHSATVVSTDDIEAGEELFFNHGYHWYLAPQDQEKALMDALPMENPRVKEFWTLHEALHLKHGEALTGELRTKLWTMLQKLPLDSALQHILPSSHVHTDTVKTHVENGGKRTLEWLRQNGLCVDNIIQGPSKIAQAGRGAFSTRTLKKDTMIAPAPLVHILDKTTFNMYRPMIDHDYNFLMSEEVAGKQLMLNYCFGHHESSKLLCPIGANTAFVNHSPTPNAALRWSNHQTHQKDWLNMTVEELGSKMDIGLILEYYALRDLEEGEEITINYGAEWEQAWKSHIETWEKPQSSDNYISAVEMNEADHHIIRTVQEQQQDPYPHNVVTSCYYELVNDGAQRVDDSGRFGDSKEQTVWIKEFNGLNPAVPDYFYIRPCRILSRNEKNEYLVQILNFDHEDRSQIIPDTYALVVEGMPRDAITFTDYIYTSDMHLPSAFRHEMMLPDGLFPDSWRNLHPSAST